MPSLDEEIRAAGGPLELMRSGRSGSFPFPIRAEFTNWRDEQESWSTTAALMDLSHHMTDLTVEGSDCYRLLSGLAANSFKGFGPMKAKQFVAVGHDGYMVGDCILFCLADNLVRLVGRPPALNWVEYHATTGGYQVTTRSLGGSFVPDRVEDLYTTPWDLGYGHILKFDHEFIGREALERMAGEKHRTKVWLSWHRDDVARVFASMYEPGDKRFKYIEMPAAFYGGAHADRVEKNGALVGVSTLCSYSSNVRGWISVAMIDPGVAPGEEVELVWGEPDGGSANPLVERHTQTTIRATVSERPFAWDKR